MGYLIRREINKKIIRLSDKIVLKKKIIKNI